MTQISFLIFSFLTRTDLVNGRIKRALGRPLSTLVPPTRWPVEKTEKIYGKGFSFEARERLPWHEERLVFSLLYGQKLENYYRTSVHGCQKMRYATYHMTHIIYHKSYAVYYMLFSLFDGN